MEARVGTSLSAAPRPSAFHLRYRGCGWVVVDPESNMLRPRGWVSRRAVNASRHKRCGLSTKYLRCSVFQVFILR